MNLIHKRTNLKCTKRKKNTSVPNGQLLNSRKIYKTKGRDVGGGRVGLPLSLVQRGCMLTESPLEEDALQKEKPAVWLTPQETQWLTGPLVSLLESPYIPSPGWGCWLLFPQWAH